MPVLAWNSWFAFNIISYFEVFLVCLISSVFLYSVPPFVSSYFFILLFLSVRVCIIVFWVNFNG